MKKVIFSLMMAFAFLIGTANAQVTAQQNVARKHFSSNSVQGHMNANFKTLSAAAGMDELALKEMLAAQQAPLLEQNFPNGRAILAPTERDLNSALNMAGGNLTFTNDATYPWTVETEGDREYAKSGNGGVGSSTSTITTTVTAAEGDMLIFDYKAWGEGSDSYDWDKCRFYVDGEVLMDYGNHDNDWETFQAALTAGEHTLTWTYKKDSSVNATGDYFAVDNVYVGEPYDVTVTFIDGVDNSVISTLEVAWGSVLEDSDFPTPPTHEGLEFVGWNYNGSPITSDITVKARYRDPNAQTATIILNVPSDVWGDGSGYQMLIDADATAYGTIIPETGGLTSSGNAPAGTYDEFEYKIPENADGDLNTQNIIVTGSIEIEVPGGVYDWCITNPTPGDRVWIASSNGNIPGRYDDYEFEVGNIYEFVVTFGGQNDQVDLTITEPILPGTTFTVTFVDGYDNSIIDTMEEVEPQTVLDENDFPEAPEHEGAEFTGWDYDGAPVTSDLTITAQYYNPNSLIWDFETSPTAQGWTFVDADGDGFNWIWQQDYSNPPYCTAYEGEGLLFSESYDNDTDEALTPDNWAISPAVEIPTTNPSVTLYACGQDASWAAEHFQIYAGTTNDVNEMTPISDEFVTTGEYIQYEGDLSAFAGQTAYVAIRHFNITDMFMLNVDYVVVNGFNEEPQEPIAVESIEFVDLDVENVELEIGDTYTFTVAITPEDADNQEIIWTVDDEEVIAIEDAKGGLTCTVTALAAGEATLTATSADNEEATVSATITVNEPEPIEADATFTVTAPETVAPGEEFNVEVSITGEYAAHTLTYFFDYDADAFEFQSKTNGEVLNAISADDNNMVMFNTATPGRFRLGIVCGADAFTAEGVLFTATFIANEDAAEDVYTFTNEVETFSYVSVGGPTVDVPFETVDAEVEITTEEPEPEIIPVASITIDPETVELEIGETAEFTATVLPEDATNQEVVWSIEPETVATIDENGVVTAVAAGEATVTVTSADNPEIFAEATVTVTEGEEPEPEVIAVTGVEITPAQAGLIVGETTTFTANVMPENATNQEVVWSIEPTTVATIDEDGVVTAVAPGTATVTVTTVDGEFEATATVTVFNEGDIVSASINVLLNSADSPEGVEVTLTNVETEEVINITLDETGYYEWPVFMAGEYEVEIVLYGYYTINETVTINEDNNELRYVMTEMLNPANSLYVSQTGWAMWKNYFDLEGKHIEYYKVMCTSIDDEPIFNANTTDKFCQLETAELVPGEIYRCKVAVMYSTGMSEWIITDWLYMPCDEYEGTVDGVTGQITNEGNLISWTYPEPAELDAPYAWRFEDEEEFEAWENTDADGDGLAWEWSMTAQWDELRPEAYEGTGFIFSRSYSDQPLTPDNWFVSPEIPVPTASYLQYYIAPQDDFYPEDHYGVYVITENDSTLVFEETLTGDNTGEGKRGDNRNQGVYSAKTVDLSEFAGQTIQIAFRHFNCTNAFWFKIDMVTIEYQQIIGAMIFRDGEYLAYTEDDSYLDEEGGEHEYCVRIVYGGPAVLPDYNIYFSMSCPECITTDEFTVVEIEELTIAPTDVEMLVGETADFVASFAPDNAVLQELVWTISDTDIIDFYTAEEGDEDDGSEQEQSDRTDVNNTIIALAPGTATVTVSTTDGELTAVANVTVTEPEPVVIPVASITIDPETVELEIGETAEFTATVLPEDATNQEVVWSIEPETVATIDEEGVVTAVAAGEATVTVTSAENPEIFATATVTVNEPAPQPIAVTGISVTPETAEIEVGETVGFTAVIEPADADNQDVIWTVSDETIATVDENGTVTGVAAGTVTVTVTSAENAELFATAEVTVTEEVPELNDLDRALNVPGGTIHFETSGTYPWVVDNEGDREYAHSSNAGVASSTSTLTTTVTAVAGEIIQFEFKAWGEGSSTFWDHCDFLIDGQQQFTYGAYDNDWEVFYAVLTAGTHNLTWSYTKDGSVNPTGDYFAVDNVYKGEPVHVEEIVANDVDVLVNRTAIIDYTVLPASAQNKAVTFTSANTAIATVNANGVVTGVAEGTTTVTIASVDVPTVTATVNINVTDGGLTAVKFYGIDTYDFSGEFDGQWISFMDYDPGTLTGFGTAPDAYAAAYAYGNVYGYTTAGQFFTIPMGQIDPQANILTQKSYTEGTVTSMSFDYTSGVFYAVSVKDAGSYLVAISPEDGTVSDVAMLANHVYGLAIDENGVGYGVGADGTLYNINLQTAAQTAIGNTGVSCSYVQDLCYDFDNGDLYWAQLYDASNASFYRVDKNTAMVENLGIIGSQGAEVVGLFMIPTEEPGPIGNVDVTGVTVSPATAEIRIGNTQQLVATVQPFNATNKAVTWSVADSNIATVDANGLVTGVAEGTTVVTVTTVDGGYTATSTITVIPGIGGLAYGFYFETDPIAEGWQFVDADGDGFNWNWNIGDGSNMNVYEGEGIIYSASYDNDTYQALTPDNWAIAPAVTLPQGTASVSLYAAGQDPSYASEHFQIYAGTTNNINEMTAVSTEFITTGDYVQYEGNLNAFAGQTVYVAIRHFHVTDQFLLNIDQFEIFAQADDAVVENGSMNLYPNPTSGNVKIEAEGMNHITVVSVLGQVVYDAQVEGNETMLNMAQFNAGVYVVRVNTVNGIMTKRVTVVR